MRTRWFLMLPVLFLVAGGLFAWALITRPAGVAAAPLIYASPVNAGCYIAAPNDCRLHVEPFTINLAPGAKLVNFRLVTIQAGSGTQTLIYDFRPDLSNPVPYSGATFTPSLVAQDFAATCGRTYSLNLQGQDTSDPNPYSLGLTAQFTCPATVP